MGRLVLTWRDNARLLRASQDEAMADALTGLGNRRALLADLERRLATVRDDSPFTLVLFDLDGFKQYNDIFGHPSGDALLRRLGRKLESHLGATGRAYRIGGDEFCALIDAPAGARTTRVEAAAAALFERGDGFTIGCSHGAVSAAHRSAGHEHGAHDRRPAHVRLEADRPRLGGATIEGRAAERASPSETATSARTATTSPSWPRPWPTAFSLPLDEVEMIRQAAELHDVGKVAVPDAILDKPAALDEREWASMREHTLIGEKIIAAAPDLARVARLVRSSHENYDGTGYPRARTPGDPARLADHRGVRRVRRDDDRPPLPRGDGRGAARVRASPLCRNPIRS